MIRQPGASALESGRYLTVHPPLKGEGKLAVGRDESEQDVNIVIPPAAGEKIQTKEQI